MIIPVCNSWTSLTCVLKSKHLLISSNGTARWAISWMHASAVIWSSMIISCFRLFNYFNVLSIINNQLFLFSYFSNSSLSLSLLAKGAYNSLLTTHMKFYKSSNNFISRFMSCFFMCTTTFMEIHHFLSLILLKL